jgi:hypothetical protein
MPRQIELHSDGIARVKYIAPRYQSAARHRWHPSCLPMTPRSKIGDEPPLPDAGRLGPAVERLAPNDDILEELAPNRFYLKRFLFLKGTWLPDGSAIMYNRIRQ